MSLLGLRLRQRRKQMRLRQKDIAGGSSSFLSKVESGTATPSLANLTDWSNKLNTPAGELLGDHLVLEAAKQSILLTEKCLAFLDHLPSSNLTTFLRQLSISATSLSTPVPKPPQEPELQYLTTKVLLHRGMIIEAKELVIKALSADHFLWRIHHLSLLCLIYEKLSETEKHKQAKEELLLSLQELDYDKLLHTLPDAEAVSIVDLDLLKLSALLQHSSLLLE